MTQEPSKNNMKTFKLGKFEIMWSQWLEETTLCILLPITLIFITALVVFL